MGKEEKKVKEFYRKLRETLQAEKEYYNIIMGDYNAKIGKGKRIDGVMGPYGIGERNENRKKFTEFAGSNNLKNSEYPIW